MNILLPDFSWMSMNSPNPLPSIPPETSMSVSLLLTPELTETLTLFSGNLMAVPVTGNSISIPYEFRVVSDLTGDLEIEVVDEYFFYTAEAPKLEGATVTLRDAINSEEITSAETGADGIVRFEDVMEGWYLLEVDSPDHTQFRGNFYVSAGETTHHQVFVSRELVTYTWTVEEIEIDDRYRIAVESTFETNVPAPVVTVEPASLDVSDLNALGQTKVVNLRIENHGLIDADHGELLFGSHPFYEIKPLIRSLGTIPAKNTIVIPVTITRVGVFASDGTIDTLRDMRQRATTSVPCGITATFSWGYPCGETNVGKSTPIAVSGVQGYCPGDTGIMPDLLGSSGGGSGASFSSVTFSTPTFCDCPFFFFDGLCLEGSKKVNINAIADAMASALSAVLPPWITVEDVNASLQADGKVCVCCQDGSIAISGDASAKALISVQLVVGLQGGYDVMINEEGWTDVTANISVLAGARLETTGEVGINVDKECHGDMTGCVTGSIGLEAFAGVELDGYASATWLVPDTNTRVSYSGTARGALGVHGSAYASVTGCLDGSLRYQACATLTPEATLELKMEAAGYEEVVLGGSLDLPHGKAGICPQNAARSIARSLFADAASPQLPYDFEVPGSEYLRSDQEILANEFPELFETSDGVCARVKIRVDQDAVMTRSAFRASLELGNNLEDGSLSDVGFDFQVLDDGGQPANDVFNIQVTTIEGVSAIDGTGAIGPLGTGTVVWTLIPRDSAAPEHDTVYTIGGTISYVQDSNEFSIPVVPVSITVIPDAALSLKYFHQRDVFSDDPHTDATEPAIPYALAVMVENKGAGAARNLTITTAQPEIVDNEKGLFIGFQVIGTEVAGQNLSPSLTANFGDIAPGERKIATWLLTSTLQGLFLDYDATFEHLDGFGDPRLSLIKNVEIHEMRHMIEALGSKEDGLPDFLVNDVADIDDLPDTVHLSDGTTEPVNVYESASITGNLGEVNLSVTLDTSMNPGWAYLLIPDPGDGAYRLVSVTRSDGLEIPLDKNVWVTDRTFEGFGRRPIYENMLHLVDCDSTGQYTLYYAPITNDSIPPDSHVESLNESSSVQIPVLWVGTDNTAVAYFDIYVSIDGGPFTPWLEKTIRNSAIYMGVLGKSYAFFSRATDISGNTEAAPSAPDATTVVNVENAPPVLNGIGNQVIYEGEALMLNVDALDPDGAENTLMYSVDSDATGLIINQVTGELSWITNEMDGGRMVTATVTVTDSGSPKMIASETITIEVKESNDPPRLRCATIETAQSNDFFPVTIIAGESVILDFDASDPDLPSQNLTFSLAENIPSGAVIDASTGIFHWTPTELQYGQNYTTLVQVSDNGINPPALNDTISLIITVTSASDDMQIIGDLNGDESVNLTDAIIGLQVLAGVNSSGIRSDYKTSGADVNKDGKLGLEEISLILRKISGTYWP